MCCLVVYNIKDCFTFICVRYLKGKGKPCRLLFYLWSFCTTNWLMCSLQKRINDIQTERETVKNQMTLAENELQKTEDLVEMLYDSKTVCCFPHVLCLKYSLYLHISYRMCPTSAWDKTFLTNCSNVKIKFLFFDLNWARGQVPTCFSLR